MKLAFHPNIEQQGEREFVVRLDAQADEDPVGKEIYFRFLGAARPSSRAFTEASLALGLVPAMKLGEPLQVEGSTVSSLLENIERFQEIFHCWYKDYTEVPVKADTGRVATPPSAGGVGLFFSGGADSLYSLLRHRDEITHLIFVHGCDIRLEQEAFRQQVSVRLRETCAHFGKELIEVETDLLAFSDAYGHWGYHYHGCAFAAIAMLMCDTISKVHIASSGAWDDLAKWGSHVITDPLWSTPLLQVAQDGLDRDRTDKILFLATQPGVCDHLRVCWESDREMYNCGKCEKCLRTMVALEFAGALQSCRAFPPLDLKLIADELLLPPSEFYLNLWANLYRRAQEAGDYPELAAALRRCRDRNGHAVWVSQFGRENLEILSSERWGKLLPKVKNKLLRNLAGHDSEWFDHELAKWAPKSPAAVVEELWKADHRGLRRRVARLARRRRWAKLKRLFGR